LAEREETAEKQTWTWGLSIQKKKKEEERDNDRMRMTEEGQENVRVGRGTSLGKMQKTNSYYT